MGSCYGLNRNVSIREFNSLVSDINYDLFRSEKVEVIFIMLDDILVIVCWVLIITGLWVLGMTVGVKIQNWFDKLFR